VKVSLTIDGRRINVERINPPIPDRRYDWCASEDNYDQGACLGWGSTLSDAVYDLREQLED
jgi:hypothetical protein